MDEFKMELPRDYIESLNRRHHGRNLPSNEIQSLKNRMDILFKEYEKICKSYDTLDNYWDREEVEKHFMRPKWYNAHSRLKKLEERKDKNWKELFYTLLKADGNHESFDSYSCISPQEIYDDFNDKYIINSI